MATDAVETDPMANGAAPTAPLARRPLDSYGDRLAQASGDAVRLEIIAPKSILNLRGRADDPAFADAMQATLDVPLPTEPNRCHSGRDKGTIYWLGPDEWLVMAQAGAEAALEQAIRAARPDDPWLAITDLSHAYTGLRLSGIRTRDVLAGGCPLDLHQRAFDVDHCAQTVLAKSRILLRQISVEPAFDIWVRNSFARYSADWLLDAAKLLEPEA